MEPRLAVHRGVSALEALYVLNERETVPLSRLGFLVITGTYTPHWSEPRRWPFTPGEVLVVHHTPDGTHEFLGQGRDLLDTRWEDMHWCTHRDDNLGSALGVAALVASDRPRGYYEWTADGLTYCADQAVGEELWCSRQDGSVVRVADHAGRRPWRLELSSEG
ncbi:hypothetical protein M2271_007228 [Streptomyces sp. LBL]|uniref:hypothetical protein n=1 Tax=Streptomyces sp. LBL TaxID=2940562 RepID=UPI002474EE02|nr:hypothetical protein [Streptomyces sp. LBL]MDH6629392.1 hypothetical protein [Streptomyces sp. LBL]